MEAATVSIESDASDWAVENRRGRIEADALIAEIQDRSAPNLLGVEIKRLIEAGVYGGVAVGFCHRLAECLLAGS